MQPDEKAADYGESDIEAKAMTQASSPAKRPSDEDSRPAPAGPVCGTTETNIEANINEKQQRVRQN